MYFYLQKPGKTIKAYSSTQDDDEVNEGEDPTGRERVQNALGEDTSSAAVTRFEKSPILEPLISNDRACLTINMGEDYLFCLELK